ncbi:hypothetical protein HOB94_04120 [bacterium]|nr:hypothetical protein [bacterium]
MMNTKKRGNKTKKRIQFYIKESGLENLDWTKIDSITFKFMGYSDDDVFEFSKDIIYQIAIIFIIFKENELKYGESIIISQGMRKRMDKLWPNIELDENTIEAAFMTAHSIHICYQA